MRTALSVAALLTALGVARPSRACLIVGTGDQPAKVAGEEVLIVWNAKTQTEQLVRHLSFKDATGDFGFIVPTPAQPKLDEANDKIFAALYEVYRRHAPPTNEAPAPDGLTAAAAPRSLPPVTEVEHKRVAGLDATVLLASDPSALADWLAKHHYKTSPATTDYLRPYVSQHWYLTAFRYDPAQQHEVRTRAVKLTFHSDRPFFPYAEPSDAPHVWGRAFRVTVIGPERVRGEIDGQLWPTFPSYASRLRDADGSGPAWDEVLRMSQRRDWMTTFDERVEARGQSDLYFETDPAPVEVKSGLEDKIE